MGPKKQSNSKIDTLLISSEWEIYSREALSKKLPPQALHELKQIFFAGSVATMRVLEKITAEDPNADQDDIFFNMIAEMHHVLCDIDNNYKKH